MRGVLLDTSVLFALADPNDQYHARAKAERSHASGLSLRFLASYPTLLETHSLVLRNLPLPYARSWLQEVIERLEGVNPSPGDYLSAAMRFRRFSDQDISLHDATLAVLSEQLEIPVWTFDRHFELLGAQIWRP